MLSPEVEAVVEVSQNRRPLHPGVFLPVRHADPPIPHGGAGYTTGEVMMVTPRYYYAYVLAAAMLSGGAGTE